MILTINGVGMDFPLYDAQGALIYKPYSPLDDIQLNEPSESRLAESLLSEVSNALSNVEESCIHAELGSGVNVYEYTIDDSGSTIEYYTVILNIDGDDSGTWSSYLKALSKLMNQLESTFDDSWIRNIEIDVPNNAFQVEIALLLGENN